MRKGLQVVLAIATMLGIGGADAEPEKEYQPTYPTNVSDIRVERIVAKSAQQQRAKEARRQYRWDRAQNR